MDDATMSDGIPADVSEAENLPDYQSSLETARSSGWSWNDIWSHLTGATAAADKAGYTQPEIDAHLGFQPPEAFEARSTASWATAQASDPGLLDDMADGKVDLAANPAMRTEYVNALKAGEVKGPLDFAQRYGAAAVGAAHDVHNLDDEAADTHLASASAAAAGLATALPTREDLADATVALNPDDPKQTRANLLDHWADTGQDPVSAAQQALGGDAALATKLMQEELSDPLGPAIRGGLRAIAGSLEGVEHIGEAGVQALASVTGSTGIKDAVADAQTTWTGWEKSVAAELADGAAAHNPAGYLSGILGQGAVTVAEYMTAGVPVMMALGGLSRAVDEYHDTGSIPATAAAAVIGTAEAGAPAPFLHNAMGKGLIEAAITGAVGMSLIGVAQTYADPIPNALASGDYQWPTWENVKDAAVTGAVTGGLLGAFGGMAHPRVNSFDPTIADAVHAFSPEEIDRQAKEAGPVHEEASRIARLPEEQHEGELAKLTATTEEGAEPPLDRAAVEELIPGYQAASALYGHFKGLMGDILNDETGAMSLYHGTGVNFAGERGSPFGRFQMEKVGAGEGAQFFSHGLYFAEDPRIAEWYKKMDVLRKGAKPDEGSLYTVHVDLDPATQMLDWDRPLSAQHPDIQRGVTAALGDWAAKGPDGQPRDISAMTGEQLFKRLMIEKGATVSQTSTMTGPGNKAASEALLAQKVRGMQFRGVGGTGPTNHVIYDASDVKITHRNGVPVPANTLFVDLQGLMREGAHKIGGVLDQIHSKLPSWRTPEQTIARATYDARRDAAIIQQIKGQGTVRHDAAKAAAVLSKFQGLVTPHVDELMDAARRGDGYASINSVLGNLAGYIENRNWGGTLANSKLQPVADAIRSLNLAMRDRLQVAHNEGLISLADYRDNYYRHLWEDPRGPEWEAMWHEGTGKQGSGQSFRQRTLPEYSDGLKIGLVPRIPNPIDLTLYDLGQKSRYLTALQIIKEAKDAGHVYYASSPDEPGDRPLTGVKSEFAVGKNVTIKAYGKDGYHQIYNRALEQGMLGSPQGATLYERTLWAGNVATQLKLINPMFHARVVGLASFASGIEQVLGEIGRGQGGWAFLHAGETVAWAPKVAIDATVGFRSISRFKSGQDDPTLKLLNDAGLVIGRRQLPYKMAQESLVETARRGMAPGQSLTENVVGAGRELMKAIGKDIVAVIGNETEGMAKRITLLPFRAIALPITEFGRGMQTITAPLFDHWIPALKVGAAYRQLSSWLDANKLVSDDAKWAKAREIVKDIDNRYGELNQDTMFISKTSKQAMNLAMISPGWNIGSYRGFLTLLGIDAERAFQPGMFKWNPSSVLGTIGTVTGYALFNAVEQYLRTGQTPWQTGTPWQDLIAYRTGGTTKYGAPERGGVPSELKEVFDQAKILANGMVAPGLASIAEAKLLLGKSNPFFQFLVAALVTGQDGAGNDINVPGGFMKFLRANFDPIFTDAIAKAKAGSGFGFWSSLLGDREITSLAEDWQGFIDRLQKYRDRIAVQQSARDSKENALLANPDPNIAAPSGGRGGGGTSRPEKFGTTAAKVRDFLTRDQQGQLQPAARGSRQTGVVNQGAAPRGTVQQVGPGGVTVLRGATHSPQTAAPRAATPRAAYQPRYRNRRR